MNGPWNDAAQAWVAGPAWGRLGESAAVEASAGAAGMALAVAVAVAAPLAGPTGGPAMSGLAPHPVGTMSVAVVDGQAISLAAVIRPGLALPWALGLVTKTGLASATSPIQATAAVLVVCRRPALTGQARPCLAGTGIREVARLASRLTTSVRLSSPVCRTASLASPIDIEQT